MILFYWSSPRFVSLCVRKRIKGLGFRGCLCVVPPLFVFGRSPSKEIVMVRLIIAELFVWTFATRAEAEAFMRHMDPEYYLDYDIVYV